MLRMADEAMQLLRDIVRLLHDIREELKNRAPVA